jgi:pimeloyl-ACP methyl ester carboxylesterase
MTQPTFVLVHGAWHGGWCWDTVCERLSAQGHACHAPTLRGLAHRSGELNPILSADDHVDDIAHLVEALDLRRVVLALHSYAGMLGPALHERLRSRLAHIAWIEAVVPQPGRAMLDMVLPEAAERYRRLAAEHGDGWRIPPPDPAQFGLPDARLRDEVAQRLTDQPLRTFAEPLRSAQADAMRVPCSYLLANDRAGQPYAQHVARAEAAGWPVERIAGGHLLMLTQPEAVTGFLLRAAGASSTEQRHP